MRNIDLAAHNSLIKDDRLRRSIPEKANSFAVQLSETLAPLFPNEVDAPAAISWDGFATWGQGIEEWRERRTRLVAVFTKALETKADSVVNIVDYEMVIYTPGMQYNKDTMTVETTDGMVDNRDHDGRRIELCVEAAICAYPRGELQITGPTSEAIVQSRNFVRKEAHQREGVKPIVKAVVILKEESSNDMG